MRARERIYQGIRHGLAPRAERQRTKTAWASASQNLAPAVAQLEGRARIAQFLKSFQDMHGTYTELSNLDELPAKLTEQLRYRNLGQSVRLGSEPDFSALDWMSIEVSNGPGRLKEPATLTRAFCASAETGTMMFLSGPQNPVTLNFLGETHFTVLKKSEIEAGFEGMWKRLRASGQDPRTVNLVTGPSRTADIEQSLELGAHGPLVLHLFLIDDLNSRDDAPQD
ncbi:MAG: LutC/YkgG family protein [Hyphomicrobiaceae bacterium]